MRVVSIINYKGGVGKTTVTANLGAGLAQQGKKVLLLDLDPQTNLTLSFYSIMDWQADLEPDRTIKRWFEAHVAGVAAPRLWDLKVTPSKVDTVLGDGPGRLDLIASHLKLVDTDMKLARELFRGDPNKAVARRVQFYRILADALEDDEIVNEYDYVLIDCAPDFGLVTQTAVVASDWLLVPSKPDHLSTEGIGYFTGSVKDLVDDYNSISPTIEPIHPKFLGVVFTMVHLYGNKPIQLQRGAMKAAGAKAEIPILDSLVRDASREAIQSTQGGVPTIIRPGADKDLVAEFAALRDEFVSRIEGPAS